MHRLIFAFSAIAISLCAKTFTLEQVMSAPFPSDMTAAPGGGAVAWVLNERGARNIWFAAAPDFHGVRLTSWTDDDGQDIGELTFLPDGKSVVFVRGGDLEYPAKADPNPASNPGGVSQDVWIAAAGSAPRKVGSGHSPAVSKDGRIAYLRNGQVWVEGGAGPLIVNRSGVSAESLRWSPDGTKLALVSNRGDHSFIEIYDFAAKSVSYMDPSVDHDSEPAWSPDGKQIAYIRVFQVADKVRGIARSSSDPWAIRIANAADGTARQLWKADEGPGSAFASVETNNQLFWSPEGRIVFPWEKDGWRHLYSIAVAGGPVTPLTPGDFEVDNVSYSQDGREAVFSSNQADIDRRHIWRVAVAGGTARPVTSGEGLEWSPVEVAGGFAFLHSDVRRPARAAVLIGSAEHDLAPETIPAGFPVDSLVAPQQVIYSSGDGLKIHAQLFLPSDLKPGDKRPAIVFLHGGPRRQMLLGWHSMDYYNNAYAMNQYLANHGYIVLAINYRSGIGYGLDFREATNFGAAGASEFSDVEGAGLYLRSRGDVDGSQIGLWGGSYGGYLTALGLARASDLFKAGVDFHGVHDWNLERPLTGPVPGTATAEAERETAAEVQFESSPLASVKTWKSPVLLIHGDDDRNVSFANTVQLVAALRKQGVDFEQMILPDEIHGFLLHRSWLKTYAAAADFFKRKL
ncbi:MAG TPA: prolyl oligopeptidase family serine peptidase [Bryobacteraceae bacterium]|nr:prolyl oligopeptidase family serine peptidase [Bryobacteraceae bacterium]